MCALYTVFWKWLYENKGSNDLANMRVKFYT